ncbi:22685_t:CDS:1, partial [Racocetra persica]
SIEEDSDSSSISDDNSISISRNLKHWQYAYQYFRQQIKHKQKSGHCHSGYKRSHITKKKKNYKIEDTNKVKYLPPTDTTNFI